MHDTFKYSGSIICIPLKLLSLAVSEKTSLLIVKALFPIHQSSTLLLVYDLAWEVNSVAALRD